MRGIWTIALCFAFGLVRGQWSSVGGGVLQGQPYNMWYDTASARLYAGGDMRYMWQDSLMVNGVCYYENGAWHQMRSGVTHPYNGLVPEVAVVRVYDSTVVAAGSFHMMDSVPNTAFVAEWHNGSWHSMGLDTNYFLGGIFTGMNILDDKLQLVGSFELVAGTDTIPTWAVWDGTNWSHGFAGVTWPPEDGTVGQLNAVCDYKGKRYIGGNFQPLGGPNDIAVKEGNQYVALSTPIHGDPWVNRMAVYDSLLWVAGEFYAAAGNAASGLMAWDGTNWLNPFPQISFFSSGLDVEVFGNKLFFSGPFHVAGLNGDYRIGEFDGHTLCILGGPDIFRARLAGSSDTLYAQACYFDPCGDSNGLQLQGIAKLPFNAQADTCFTVWVGVHEVPDAADRMEVYPNPTTSTLAVANIIPTARTLTILDILGRSVLQQTFNRNTPLDVSPLAPGTYTLRLFDARGGPVGVGRFVRE